MAKAFSVASWNVEHFGAKDKNRRRPKKLIEPIIEYLASQRADVLAICEVVGSVVFEEMVTRMPEYQFNITEGPQSQEILVGVREDFYQFLYPEVRVQVRLCKPCALVLF